ncbi:hypothetical protein ACHAWF_004472 [Thalassiosira exigua]
MPPSHKCNPPDGCSSPPEEEKQDVRPSRPSRPSPPRPPSANDTSWRAKSIEKFGLQEVPDGDGWKDMVPEASEQIWKKYYDYRCRVVERKKQYLEEDVEAEHEFIDKWEHIMETRIQEFMVAGCKWHWTGELGYVDWNGGDQLRSSGYYSHVWSPYAIPHAIALEHRYHCRARLTTVEWHTIWGYRLLDFEDDNTIESDEYTTICSDCFEDEELRADVIDQSHMNESTTWLLRKHLFGSFSEECNAVTCSDKDFWLLLFGSMGTTDPNLAKDPYGGVLGYEWVPYRDMEMRRKLHELKAKEGDDAEGDPNGPFEQYYPSGCSWLKYRLLEITGNLGPVTKHYKPPTIQDAIGYREEYEEHSDY